MRAASGVSTTGRNAGGGPGVGVSGEVSVGGGRKPAGVGCSGRVVGASGRVGAGASVAGGVVRSSGTVACGVVSCDDVVGDGESTAEAVTVTPGVTGAVDPAVTEGVGLTMVVAPIVAVADGVLEALGLEGAPGVLV